MSSTADQFMECDVPSSEEYIINRAKNALKTEPFEAKSWMLTAQILFPYKFMVQFEAYQIEKSTLNIREAAKRLSSLLEAFSNEPELCLEVQTMTAAIRKHEETEGNSEPTDYYVRLFYQLPSAVQSSLLLSCAEKCPEPMEHCKLMLLYFKKFPRGVKTYGPQLMESLFTAEKHSSPNVLNNVRKLLVCDLLPLLCDSHVDVSSKNLHQLLDKSTQLYIAYIFDPSLRGRKEDGDSFFVEDPWQRLFEIVLNIGSKLGWSLALCLSGYWNKDNCLKMLTSAFNPSADCASHQVVAFLGTLVLLRCYHEYEGVMEPGNVDAPGFALVEAFVTKPESNLSRPSKQDEDLNVPLLTVGGAASSSHVHSFVTAVRCLEFLHHPALQNEYIRLRNHLKVQNQLQAFQQDADLYRGHYENACSWAFKTRNKSDHIAKEVVLCVCHYFSNNLTALVDSISTVAGMLQSLPVAGVPSCSPLTMATKHKRHLHFLPLTKSSILNYIVKLMLAALKQKKSDLAVGHMLVLIQLNWPAECELLGELTKLIELRGGFSYSIFTSYIINVDILEEFAYLSSEKGPKVPLDIFPVNQQIHNQRRMSTRGVDKGVKEDLKMAIRGQVARSNEPIDELIIRFLKCERDYLLHSVTVQHSVSIPK